MVMHDGKPYGHMVANNGQPLTEQQIAQRCGCRNAAELRKVVAEIEALGIPGRTGDSSYREILDHAPIDMKGISWKLDLSPLAIEQVGVMYSRRMLRDRILSMVRFLVSPRGSLLLVSLLDGLKQQTPEFDRVRAGDQKEGEEEVGSLSQSSEEPEEVQEKPKPIRALTPQQEAVKIILEAFPEDVRPHPGLAARWISQMAEGFNDPDPLRAATAVREIVWKYPTKGADYVGKCVGTAATNARTNPKEITHGHRNDDRRGNPRPRIVTLAGNE
jgi:hypothetical protein